MNIRLTRRFILDNMDNLNLSIPIRYERYYINDNLRIQKKNDIFEKEILKDNNIILKEQIDIIEFEFLKQKAYKEIIKDNYMYLDDEKISIKKYYNTYEGLIRIEVKFETEKEMKAYQRLIWMGEEITDSLLAFDKDLSKLDRELFLKELNKYI